LQKDQRKGRHSRNKNLFINQGLEETNLKKELNLDTSTGGISND